MLSATILQTNIKSGLVNLFTSAYNGDTGMDAVVYADAIAQIIADKVVAHITANAQVTTTVTGTAGPYPVIATGSGTIS